MMMKINSLEPRNLNFVSFVSMGCHRLQEWNKNNKNKNNYITICAYAPSVLGP